MGEGQVEKVKAHVSSQQWLGDVKVGCVGKAQHRFPLAGSNKAENEAYKACHGEDAKVNYTAYHQQPLSGKYIASSGRR